MPEATLGAVIEQVPDGKCLKTEVRGPSGQALQTVVVDPDSRRGFRETTRQGGGNDLTVFDDSGHATLEWLRLRVLEAPAGFDEFVSLTDWLSGREAVPSIEKGSDGTSVDMFSAVVDAEAGEASYDVAVGVDRATGLRVKEEWRQGDRTLITLERQLVDMTVVLAERMEKSALEERAAAAWARRIDEVKEAGFVVQSLSDDVGLALKYIVPGAYWKHARLEYTRSAVDQQVAAVVSTWDLRMCSDYPQELLLPMEDAEVETGEGGVRLCFRLGDTGIQVQASEFSGLDVRALAGQLVAFGS